MNKMQKAINKLQKSGYTKNFVINDGLLWSENRSFGPREVEVEATIRIEDDSDPTNQSILYGLRCIKGGPKGLVINGFGPQADAEKDRFIESCET